MHPISVQVLTCHNLSLHITTGLDEYLDKMRHHESEELQVQISAYLDNVFDVAALMDDSETKTAALERLQELEDELAHVRN